MLKGHPPGCFHSISGQNAGLVSHLERQEWGIFTFINPTANTLMDMDSAWMRISSRTPAGLAGNILLIKRSRSREE